MDTMLWPRHSLGLFDRLWEAFDRDWGLPRGEEFPPINVYTNDEGALVTVELPGIEEKDLELSLENDTLTLRGKRSVTVPEGATVLRRERRDYSFTRSIRLPFQAEPKKGAARYENGILNIELHRREADKPRRIAITSK